MVLETELIEKQPKLKRQSKSDKTIVETAIRLLNDNESIRLDKVNSVRRNKRMINTAISGELPTRLTSFPSYLAFHVVKLFSTLVNIPDKRLIIPGTIVTGKH